MCGVALGLISAWQIANVLFESWQVPTVTLVRVKEKVQFPVVTVCPVVPYANFDFDLMRAEMNMTENLFFYIVTGMGFFFPRTQFYCYERLLDKVQPSSWNWTDLEIQLGLLMKNQGLRDPATLVSYLYNHYSYSCNSYLDRDPETTCGFNGQYKWNECCKYFEPVFNLEKGLCYSLHNRSHIDPRVLLAVTYAIPESSYKGCDMNTVTVTMSDVPEAAPQLSAAVFTGQVETFYLRVASFSNIKNCFNGAWSPKYLPKMPDTDYQYSYDNCIAELMVRKFWIEPEKCVPAIYQNPDNLPICPIGLVANRTLSLALNPSLMSEWFAWYGIFESASECLVSCVRNTYSYTRYREGPRSPSNATSLKFQFESLDVLESMEQRQTDFIGWCGSIGGILGLWLGFSFFSIPMILYRAFKRQSSRKGDCVLKKGSFQTNSI